MWHATWPAQRLKELGQDAELGGRDRRSLPPCDLLVCPAILWLFDDSTGKPRLSWSETRNAIDQTHASGAAVAVDFDNDLPGAYGCERYPFLELCDGATVATPTLAISVRRYMRPDVPVIVVPNAIHLAPYRGAADTARHTRPIPSLIVGYVGTIRPGSNFTGPGMAQAWGAIARCFPDVVFLTIGCPRPPAIDQYVPADRFVSLPPTAWQYYPSVLGFIDVGCCPLEDTQFNRGKSPQKAWELALAGAPVVCSPTVYGDDCRLADNGALIARAADDWERHIARLLECPSERQERVTSLQGFVRNECRLDANINNWSRAWRTVVDRARANGLVHATASSTPVSLQIEKARLE